MIRRLIFNADDYGRSAEINSAVEELIVAGRLRDVSVLVNGQSFDSAVRFLRAHPQVSVGIHFNAVEGKPISNAVEVRSLTSTTGEFIGLGKQMLRWMSKPFVISRAVELEWRAQLEALLKAGLQISHADSHQHLHAFPLAWSCAIKLCQEHGIPGLRLPRERNDLPFRRAGALALGASLMVSELATPKHRLLHNDHFLGFKRAGEYRLQALLADLQTLQPGVTEIALHPSTKDNLPYSALFGDAERQALLDSSLPEVFANLGIELTTWRDLAQGNTDQSA